MDSVMAGPRWSALVIVTRSKTTPRRAAEKLTWSAVVRAGHSNYLPSHTRGKKAESRTGAVCLCLLHLSNSGRRMGLDRGPARTTMTGNSARARRCGAAVTHQRRPVPPAHASHRHRLRPDYPAGRDSSVGRPQRLCRRSQEIAR